MNSTFVAFSLIFSFILDFAPSSILLYFIIDWICACHCWCHAVATSLLLSIGLSQMLNSCSTRIPLTLITFFPLPKNSIASTVETTHFSSVENNYFSNSNENAWQFQTFHILIISFHSWCIFNILLATALYIEHENQIKLMTKMTLDSPSVSSIIFNAFDLSERKIFMTIPKACINRLCEMPKWPNWTSNHW